MKTIFDVYAETLVRIEAEDGTTGTGFAVAPGLILTCAHLVRNARHITLTRDQRKSEVASAAIRFPSDPSIDLALLSSDVATSCAALNGDAQPQDPVFARGFTTDYELEPLNGVLEGESSRPPLLKFKATQVVGGMSGAPLLNMRTGGICGVIMLSRDIDFDLGGRAVPLKQIEVAFPELLLTNRRHARNDPRWLDVLSPAQRDAGDWRAMVLLLRGEAVLEKELTGSAVHQLARGRVLAVAPTTNGDLLVVARGGVFLLDTESASVVWEMRAPVESGAISPDEAWLALGVADVLRFWDVSTGEEHWRVGCRAYDVEFSSSSNLAVVKADGGLRLFRPRDRESLMTLAETENRDRPWAFSWDDKYFFSTTIWSSALQWATGNGEQLPKLELSWWEKWYPHEYAGVIALDDRHIAAGGKTLEVWNFRTREHRQSIEMSSFITAMAIHPPTRRLVEAREDGSIAERSADALAQSNLLGSIAPASASRLAFSRRGETLAAWDGKGRVQVIRRHASPREIALCNYDFHDVVAGFSPDGRTLAFYDDGAGVVRFLSTASGTPTNTTPIRCEKRPSNIQHHGTSVAVEGSDDWVFVGVSGNAYRIASIEDPVVTRDGRAVIYSAGNQVSCRSLESGRVEWAVDYACTPWCQSLDGSMVVARVGERSVALISVKDGTRRECADAIPDGLIFQTPGILPYHDGFIAWRNGDRHMNFISHDGELRSAKISWLSLIFVGQPIGATMVSATKEVAFATSLGSIIVGGADAKEERLTTLGTEDAFTSHPMFRNDPLANADASLFGLLIPGGGFVVWERASQNVVLRTKSVDVDHWRFNGDTLYTLGMDCVLRHWRVSRQS